MELSSNRGDEMTTLFHDILRAPKTAPAQGERRIITALFCDVVRSTALAEGMDPEDWREIMNRAFAILTGPIERYDGTVARGSYGDTQVHRDQETNWLSTSYTTNEHGSPAPDDPNPPTGTYTGGGSSGATSPASTWIPPRCRPRARPWTSPGNR